jgi:transcriptional regulator with XRE-family HTH domain
MEASQAFCSRLREAMQGRSMTQTMLARQLGVRDATVSDWFNRGTMPSGSVMLRLPEVLGVDGHWLLTGKPSPGNGAGVRGLAEEERAQVATLMEIALRIVRGEAGDRGAAQDEGTFLRVREAAAGERLALEAIDSHRAARGQRGRKRAGS